MDDGTVAALAAEGMSPEALRREAAAAVEEAHDAGIKAATLLRLAGDRGSEHKVLLALLQIDDVRTVMTEWGGG